MTERTQRVTIVGAGICGLACAYRLGQLGISATALERSPNSGGVIDREETHGFLFESGPQSFLGGEPLLTLVRELGLEAELQIADPSAPRFIVKGQRLQKMPMSPQAMLRSSFLAPGSRWKLASEPWRKTKPPANDESIASFVRRKFGNEILEYLVAPFVSGVYAGDPERLSLKAAFPTLDEWERQYGSVLRGAVNSRPAKNKRMGAPPLCSFTHGVAALPRALAASLDDALHYEARAVSVNFSTQPSVADGSAASEIRIVQNGQEQRFSANAVIIATPAYAAAHLLETFSPQLARTLSGIAY